MGIQHAASFHCALGSEAAADLRMISRNKDHKAKLVTIERVSKDGCSGLSQNGWGTCKPVVLRLCELMQDEVGVIINVTGQPAQSALTFPSTPIALAASGLYILAACTDAVHIYDRTSSAWVQSLPYPPGIVPSPGQSIATAYNTKGSCVLFSGLYKVGTLMPTKHPLPPLALPPTPPLKNQHPYACTL